MEFKAPSEKSVAATAATTATSKTGKKPTTTTRTTKKHATQKRTTKGNTTARTTAKPPKRPTTTEGTYPLYVEPEEPLTEEDMCEKKRVQSAVRLLGFEIHTGGFTVKPDETEAGYRHQETWAQLYWRNTSNKTIKNIEVVIDAYPDEEESQAIDWSFVSGDDPPTQMGYIYRWQQGESPLWTWLPVVDWETLNQDQAYLAQNVPTTWSGKEFMKKDVYAQVGKTRVKLTDKDKQQNTALAMTTILALEDFPYDEETAGMRMIAVDHIRVRQISILYMDDTSAFFEEDSSQYAFW